MRGITTNLDRWLSNDGPSLEKAIKSSKDVIDMISYEYQDIPIIMQAKEIVLSACEKFLRNFYANFVHGSNVYDLNIDKGFSNRRDDLEQLVQSLSRSWENLTLLYQMGNKHYKTPFDLARLKYFPNKKDLRLVIMEDPNGTEEWEVVDVVVIHDRPKSFACLFRAVTMLYKMLWDNYVDPKCQKICYQIALQLVSVTKIGGFFNSTDKEKVEFLDKAYDRLTKDRSEEFKIFEGRDLYDILSDPEMVKRDIIRRTYDLPHFKGLTLDNLAKGTLNAIRRRSTKAHTSMCWGPLYKSLKSIDLNNVKYSPDDLYVSMRANPAKWPSGIIVKKNGKKYIPHEAFIKSAFETDVLNVPEFDQAVQYCYKYNDFGGKYNGWVHSVICIDNPNKYKPRIIHLFLNCINDRMMLFNNLGQRRHKVDQTLCTEDHQIGRDFTRKVTSPAFRSQEWMEDASAFMADWSDATDNIRQDFQLEVIEALYGPVYRKLWEAVLKIPFVMIYPNNMLVREGIQINGQPQGAPGSFTAFSDAGEVLFMMLHNALCCKHRIEDLLMEVGDDSIYISLDDPECIASDIYSIICNWAGIKLNASKSKILYARQPVWSAEFCKVSSSNGEYFSKIPHGLFFNFNRSEADWFATVNWCQTYGYEVRRYLDDMLHKKYGEFADTILTSFKRGWSKGFKVFEDDLVKMSLWTYRDILFYVCFTVNHIRSMLVDCFFDERTQRRMLRNKEDPWKSCHDLFFNKEVFDTILETINDNHKLVSIMENNFQANEILSQFTSNIVEARLSSDSFPVVTLLNIDKETLVRIHSLSIHWSKLKQLEREEEVIQYLEMYHDKIRVICDAVLQSKEIYKYHELTLSKKSYNAGLIFAHSIEMAKSMFHLAS